MSGMAHIENRDDYSECQKIIYAIQPEIAEALVGYVKSKDIEEVSIKIAVKIVYRGLYDIYQSRHEVCGCINQGAEK